MLKAVEKEKNLIIEELSVEMKKLHEIRDEMKNDNSQEMRDIKDDLDFERGRNEQKYIELELLYSK